MIYDQSPVNTTNGRGVTIRSDSNGINIYSGGADGVRLVDAEPTGTGAGIGLVSFNNNISLGAQKGISLSNGTTGQITINNGASTSGGVFINDYAPAGSGSILLQSISNDVSIVSSNVGGGVNLSAVGTAGNITLSTNGSVTGVVISNISNGGVGTLTVDSANHLYWNGTFIA
jgi:hypothetical protein